MTQGSTDWRREIDSKMENAWHDYNYVVYWVHICGCNDLAEGYIGISRNAMTRSDSHFRKFAKFGLLEMDIIFEGTKRQCEEKERELRPRPMMVGTKNVVEAGPHRERNLLPFFHQRWSSVSVRLQHAIVCDLLRL
jgi:hypothetical protein